MGNQNARLGVRAKNILPGRFCLNSVIEFVVIVIFKLQTQSQGSLDAFQNANPTNAALPCLDTNNTYHSESESRACGNSKMKKRDSTGKASL